MFTQPIKSTNTFYLWIRALVYAVIVFVVLVIFIFLEHQSLSFLLIDRAFAFTSLLLIGTSLVLSSVGYFWNFLDSAIKYRKYIGLTGYFLLLFHLGFQSVFLSDQFPFPQYYFSKEQVILTITIGIPAVTIYTIMALISNKFAMQKLGRKTWRFLLRLGFVAYFNSLLYFSLSYLHEWQTWFQKGEVVLPLSLLVVYFGVIVLFLRICLFVAQVIESKQK